MNRDKALTIFGGMDTEGKTILRRRIEDKIRKNPKVFREVAALVMVMDRVRWDDLVSEEVAAYGMSDD